MNPVLPDAEGSTYTHEYLHRDRRGQETHWVVRSDWNFVDGRMEPTAVTVRAAGDARPVTAGVLRELPLGSILVAHRQRLRALNQDSAEWSPDHAATYRRAADEYGARRGVAMTPEGLEAVAAVYRDAFAAGQPVQAAVAEAFGIAKSTAANRIMQARRAGHDLPNPKEKR